jgi:hypothetical protein
MIKKTMLFILLAAPIAYGMEGAPAMLPRHLPLEEVIRYANKTKHYAKPFKNYDYQQLANHLIPGWLEKQDAWKMEEYEAQKNNTPTTRIHVAEEALLDERTIVAAMLFEHPEAQVELTRQLREAKMMLYRMKLFPERRKPEEITMVEEKVLWLGALQDIYTQAKNFRDLRIAVAEMMSIQAFEEEND